MHARRVCLLTTQHLEAGMHLARRPTAYRVRLNQEGRQCILCACDNHTRCRNCRSSAADNVPCEHKLAHTPFTNCVLELWPAACTFHAGRKTPYSIKTHPWSPHCNAVCRCLSGEGLSFTIGRAFAQERPGGPAALPNWGVRGGPLLPNAWLVRTLVLEKETGLVYSLPMVS